MILEAIYNGDFYHSETVVPKSEKYRNALRACEKIMDQLAQRLTRRITTWWKCFWISPPSPSARRASATSRLDSRQDCWCSRRQWSYQNK